MARPAWRRARAQLIRFGRFARNLMLTCWSYCFRRPRRVAVGVLRALRIRPRRPAAYHLTPVATTPWPRRDLLGYVAKTAMASRQLADPFAEQYTLGLAIEPPLPPEQLLRLAEECAVHSACIAAKVEDTVGRGWTLTGDNAEDPEQLADLLDSLTPLDSWQDLLEAAVWDLEAIGWAAWEVVRQRGRIVALYPLPAHTLRATTDPTRYVQERAGKTQDFWLFGQTPTADAPEIILFKRYSPRTRQYGVPRWVSGIPIIAELTAIREYNVSWFASGGTVDRLLHVRADPGPEAERIAMLLRDQLEQAQGLGHATLFSFGSAQSGVDVQFLSPTAGRREGQFSQRREELHLELLMAHRVPPYRLGWAKLGSLAGNAAQEMLEAYQIGVIEPIQRVLETQLRRTLFGPQGLRLRGKWQLNDLSWTETAVNLDIATKAVQFGLLTPNEARALIGKAPADDVALDQFYMAQSIGPVSAEPTAKSATDVVAELRAALERVLHVDVEPTARNGNH